MEDVNGVLKSDGGDKGAPPPPSPLTGCYLLIVVGEPHCGEHKDVILQRLAKGLLSWDVNDCLVDLEKELAIITEQALEGEEARCGERLIQFASENLVTEILIHPVVSTLAQCVRNLLSSFTRHRHIIHSGYTFANNGSWILQDGTFSLADFTEAFQEIEVLRVIRAYENGISLDIHCAPEGDWTRLPKECKGCKVRVNPNDVLTSGSPSITNFVNYIEPFLIPAKLENVLESSDVVGNIRFSRPTLYVFPGGQGDAALFGINGFNMLLDGGFSRKSCFWDFVRHLDRLDAVLLTRLNNSNVNGISAVLRRKMQNAVYPQIGHFFCNLQEKKTILSPDGDKDKDPLIINLLEEGQEVISNLRHLGLTPQVCYRDSEPINLYHKVGHGTLDMYVLSPAKDSKEVREFLQKWNNNDQRLFANQKSKDFVFPLQNLISICALLVWQPANPDDTITRILFPGSSPQNKIFEGIEKIKSLEFIKHPVCSEKTLAPVSVVKSKQSVLIASLEKKKVQEKALDNMLNENDLKNDMKNDLKNDQLKNNIQPDKTVKKSDSTDSEKSVSKPKKEDDKPKTITRPKTETKPKLRSDSQQRKKPVEKKASPTTPKKTFEKINGDKKLKPKASPSATPAKSAKEATNRKLESKIKAVPPKKDVKLSEKKETKETKEPKDAKVERKPISRRPKDIKSSPTRKMMNGKPDTIQKRQGKFDKEGTTDSSTVSTPSADQESVLKKDISKLTSEELQNLKAQELADLKEEQEAVKEIEAVFRKGELHQDSSDFRKIKNISIDDKESEEYLIIEKTEVDADSTKEDEIQKHTRDSEESEKLRKLSDEVKEEEIKDIAASEAKKSVSAAEAVKSQDVEETPKEISATSPEDKIDMSAKDKEKDDKEVVPDSQPDEKGSTNIESGATTTAPTLPEDERIPLDDIKEDHVDQPVEEKHVKEETKEKDIPVIQLPPKPFETISKLPPVVGIRLDKQSHIRDIVKTPDEVADLPVHEEVDYEDYQELKPSDSKDTQKESDDSSKPSDDLRDKKVETPEEDKEQIEKPQESHSKPTKIEEKVEEPKLEATKLETVSAQEKNEVRKSVELQVAEEEKDLKDKETKKEKERFDDEKDKDDNDLHKEDTRERDDNLNIETTTTKDAELKLDDFKTDIPESSTIEIKETITITEIPSKEQQKSKDPAPLLLKEELIAVIEDPIHAAVPDNAVESVKEDVNSIFQLDEKLQKLKEEVEAKEKAALHEIITLERQNKEPEHPEPVVISPGSPSSPETQEKRRSLEEEKAELGRKSPKEREEDVIKIVASVAEVLKSDAPLEEFEGKIPFSIPYKSYTTELRETHITTVESPVSEEARPIIHSDGISTILEEPTKEKEVEETKDTKNIELGTEERDSERFRDKDSEASKEDCKESKLEDAEKVTEDKEGQEENKIGKLIKDSNEILEASSKMISNIKESQFKTDEKEEHDVDASTVHRMLVTTSSEDGGEEIEICPPGTIVFSRSSESSGRSSPDPLSQKHSQKSSTFETFSSDITMVKTTDLDHQDGSPKCFDKSKVAIEYEVPITVGDNKNKVDFVSKDEEPEKSDSRKPSLDSDKIKENVSKAEETFVETNKTHELLAEISAENVPEPLVAVHEDGKSEKEVSVIKDEAKAQPSSSLKRDSIKEHDTNGVIENVIDRPELSEESQAETKDIRDVEMRKDSGSYIESQVPDKSTSASPEYLKDKSSGKVTPTDKGQDSLTRVTDDVVILSSDSNGIDSSSISSSAKGSPLPASPFKASEVDSDDKSSPLIDVNETKVESLSDKSSPALPKKDIIKQAAPPEEAEDSLEASTKLSNKPSVHDVERSEQTSPTKQSLVQPKEDSEEYSFIEVKQNELTGKSTSVADVEVSPIKKIKERKDSLSAYSVPPEKSHDNERAESGKALPNEGSCMLPKKDSGKSSPELELRDKKESSSTPKPVVEDKQGHSGISPVPPSDEVEELDIAEMSGKWTPFDASIGVKKASKETSPGSPEKGAPGKVSPNQAKEIAKELSGKISPEASKETSSVIHEKEFSGKFTPEVQETTDIEKLSGKSTQVEASKQKIASAESVEISPLLCKKEELSGPRILSDVVKEKETSIEASTTELPIQSSEEKRESLDAVLKEPSEKASSALIDVKEDKTSLDTLIVKDLSGQLSSAPPVEAKEKREPIDAATKELSGKASPASPVEVTEKRESIDASPKELSGKSSPVPPVEVTEKRESIDASPKELSGKSSPAPPVGVTEKRESTDASPKELSGKSSPAPPVGVAEKRESIDASPKELSGKSSPAPPVEVTEKRESTDASLKELSGKLSPAPPVEVTDKRESIDASPKELSGKSSPAPPVGVTEKRESIDASPKVLSGKSSPDPPVEATEKKESIDASSKVLSGKSSPAPPVEVMEKRESIKASPIELPGKLSPAAPAEVTEKRGSIDESVEACPKELPGKSSPTPPAEVKEKRQSIDASRKELSGISPALPVGVTEKRESIDASPKELSGISSPAPQTEVDEKRDSIDASPKELSGISSPALPVEVTEKRESMDASPKELSGKSSPAPQTEVNEKRDSIDASPKELSGISSPIVPVEVMEKRESIDASPKELSRISSPALPVEVTEKRESIDASPKELSGISSPAPPTEVNKNKESVDTSPKELSGVSSPAPPVEVTEKRESVNASPKELSGKSSPALPVEVMEKRKSIDASPKELSRISSPALPVEVTEKGESIDASPKELSGKSSPAPPTKVDEKRESIDAYPKELSGMSSPALPVEVTEKKELIDASPKEISGKSSPAPLTEVNEKRESIDDSPKELSRISSPALPVEVTEKKELIDASPKEISGKSSPAPLTEVNEKRESIDASPKELSRISSPALPVEVTEKRESIDASPKELSGKSSPAPPTKVDEKRESIDASPKELSGKSSPAPPTKVDEKRESIDASPKELSGKSSPAPPTEVDEKIESIDVSPKELSGVSSPALPVEIKEKRESINAFPEELSGKSSPTQPEVKENRESLETASKELSGKSSPVSLGDVKQSSDKTLVSIKNTEQEIQAKEEESRKTSRSKDMNGVLSGKSSPTHSENVGSSKVDNANTEVPKSNGGSDKDDDPQVSVASKEKAMPEMLDVQHVSEKKLSISDVEVSLIPQVSESTVSKDSSRTSIPDVKDHTDSFLKHEILDSAITHLIQTSSEHLSGKSTPDIAEVEQQKDIQETLKHEKHIRGSSTPPTVPVSPIVKNQKVEEPILTALTSLKESEIRSSTPSDCEIQASTHSDLSSGRYSGAAHYLENEPVESDDDNLPGSPMSVTSQVAHSRSSSHYDFDDDSRVLPKMDPMATSFYGSLPDEPESSFLDEADLDFEKAMAEHRKSRGEDLVEPSSSSYLYEITKAKFTSSSDSDNANLTEHSTLDQINKNGHSTVDNVMTASFAGTELPSSSDTKKDAIGTWGKPLGLPSPAPPSNNKQGTPKKEKKLPANVSVKNKLNEKRSDSPSKYKNKKLHPIYVDLSYVPHHGNAYYSYIDFFKRVRARYYVFSGIEPSREVYNALLEAKQTWEDNELEVTIIPTYDTDILGYWVAENEELLTKYKIDLSPSASRCTINLQDHETSCSAYRLEF